MSLRAAPKKLKKPKKPYPRTRRVARDFVVLLRLSDDENNELYELAERHDVSRPNMLRRILHHYYVKLIQEPAHAKIKAEYLAKEAAATRRHQEAPASRHSEAILEEVRRLARLAQQGAQLRKPHGKT